MPDSAETKAAAAAQTAAASAGKTAAKAAEKVAVQATKVKESARHLEKSAVAVERSSDAQLESAIRRTELAADRTVLAAERTYSAWVRTGLAALAGGVGARALLESRLPDFLVRLTGSVLIVFSLFCFVAAVWRQLQPAVPPPRPDTPRLPPALLVGLNGLLGLAAGAALVEIWIGRAG